MRNSPNPATVLIFLWGQTRVIDLPGNKRIIKKVALVYDTKNPAREKGVV